MSKAKLLVIAACLWLAAIGSGCAVRSFQGLMSWEEYDRQPRYAPYVLELDCGLSQLLYYGSFHSVNESHSQFEDIERKWHAFKPDVALCEGGQWPLTETRQEAIRYYGEQGLLRFLANRDRVPLRCLDATVVEQAHFLSHKYSWEHIMVFFLLRQAVIERLRGWTGEDVAPIQKVLDNLTQWAYMDDCPARVSDVVQMAKRHFPELDSWQNIPANYFYLAEQGKFLPEMFQAVNRYRDQKMLGEILAEMKKNQRVFALVGRSHVAMQTPVLLAELPGEVLHNGPVAAEADVQNMP